jgi:hypothetical protein
MLAECLALDDIAANRDKKRPVNSISLAILLLGFLVETSAAVGATWTPAAPTVGVLRITRVRAIHCTLRAAAASDIPRRSRAD